MDYYLPLNIAGGNATYFPLPGPNQFKKFNNKMLDFKRILD